MIAALHKAVHDVKRRVSMAIGRGVLTAINDATQAQEVQITLLEDEVADGIERFQEYGFTSCPHEGAEAVMAAVGGLRSHGIVIAVEDRRYRMTGLQSGEVALYDDLGQQVYLTREGILIKSPGTISLQGQGVVTVQSAAEADVIAPTVKVNASTMAVVTSPNIQLGGAGGKKIALDQDPVVGGKVQASSTKVTGL